MIKESENIDSGVKLLAETIIELSSSVKESRDSKNTYKCLYESEADQNKKLREEVRVLNDQLTAARRQQRQLKISMDRALTLIVNNKSKSCQQATSILDSILSEEPFLGASIKSPNPNFQAGGKPIVGNG